MSRLNLPNIILAVCDTLGAKHMSLYGYERRTTPYIERTTEDNNFVVYQRCFSPAPWTIPSHVSLFTGLYPGEHGVDDDSVYFSEGHHCLAEILQYLGYRTYGITCNGLVSGLLNFSRGFDEFHEMWHLFNSRDFFEMNQTFSRSKKEIEGEFKRFLFLLRLSSAGKDYGFLLKKGMDSLYKRFFGIQAMLKRSAHATERTIRTAKKIISSHPDTLPFFLFLNIMETHNQYNPPERFNAFQDIDSGKKRQLLEKYDWHHYALSPFSEETFELLNILYDREVLYLDFVLRDFYSFMRDKKIADNTLFIITSDHGELLGEHGHFNHNFSLYNELLHVPLIIGYPKDFGLRGFNDHLVQLHDIFATIMTVTGSPLPIPESSQSLLSDGRDVAKSESLGCSRAIRKFRQKNPSFQPQDIMQPHISLITKELLKIIKRADGHIEMYDLTKDFYETGELSDESGYAEKRRKMTELINDPSVTTEIHEE